MSYNTKNYTEQGGEKTVIGGTVVFEGGAKVEGGIVANQADSTATTVALLKDDYNALITKLKDSGVMIPDEWNTVSVAKLVAATGEDHKEIFEANQALVSSVSISGNVIKIVADVDEMEAYESVAGYGTKKWIGIMITTGFSSIVGMKLNGSALTQSDADETTAHSGSAGDLSLYFGAESSNGKTFKLWHTGYGEKEFTIQISAE